MKFYTVYSKERPIRLREETRKFAWESLQGKYGDLAKETPGICLDTIDGFEKLSMYEKYDRAIMKIAQEAPIRILEEEKICGAATLGYSIEHLVPATYKGKSIVASVSHVTLGFDKVVKHGMNAIEQQIISRLRAANNCEREQLNSMHNAVKAMRIWHGRYLKELEHTRTDLYSLLSKVPYNPATNFHEAVQSLWFVFAFTRLCGNWSGIGRIDEILGKFLTNDLKKGTITLDEAREILASFFIKGCEWIQSNTPAGSGDAQHYQNIVLSGIDTQGRDITCEATYLVLDIVEELGISDFPITVRVNEKTSDKLLNRVAEVIRHGGGAIAVYNEPLIIDALTDFGYPLDKARNFANDGCWEVQIPGETCFAYSPIDSLQVLLEDTLKLSAGSSQFNSMEELYSAFKSNLEKKVEEKYDEAVEKFTRKATGINWHWCTTRPCSVASIFVDGCVRNARSYLGGGPNYTVVSPHIGGAPDVANSLYAIQKFVFEEHLVSFEELMNILQNNWEGQGERYEQLRQHAQNSYIYYGNDNDEVDEYFARILDDFADMVNKLNGRTFILFPPGVSTFGRQLAWKNQRTAVPFGRKKAQVLSGNASPTPGTDVEGATAVVKSYCKANHRKQVNGSALDVKMMPSTIQGENGVCVIASLIRGFISLGGYFMQIDIMDAEVLKKAQKNPSEYKTLSVRVSGWNARFVTLDEEWQDMVIARTAQGI